MNDFLKNMVKGNDISPSDACLQSFSENFADAKNVEWSKKESFYEAIFYMRDLEHIAIFSLAGSLVEYRQNLPAEFLPASIINTLQSRGEIMNSVLKNKGNRLEYEAIIRDEKLARFQIILSDLGKIIDIREL